MQVWVFLAKGVGDNNQLLRLAGELGVPFRAIELRWNPLHVVPPRFLGASLASLAAGSRRDMRPPWPELVLGIGYRSTPVALAVRKLSRGKTKLVRLGYPRVDPRAFDLVITTAQYAVPDAANVLSLPVGLPTAPELEPTAEERAWLDTLPRPHRLLLIGGDQFMWELPASTVASVAKEIAAKPGGTVIAVNSPRSSQRVLDAAASALAGREHALVFDGFPRYPVLLRDSDEICVTADSASMIADAVATRKPVGLILPQKDWIGRLLYAVCRALGIGVPVRDVEKYWTTVLEKRLAGTVAQPLAPETNFNPLEASLAAIRALL